MKAIELQHFSARRHVMGTEQLHKPDGLLVALRSGQTVGIFGIHILARSRGHISKNPSLPNTWLFGLL